MQATSGICVRLSAASLLHVTLLQLVLAEPPRCTGGILDPDNSFVCCPRHCGNCGGEFCAERPGGGASCCGGSIRAECSTPEGPPPCVYWRESTAYEEAVLTRIQAARKDVACPIGSRLVLRQGLALCARNDFSLVDDHVRRMGRWADCDALVELAGAIGGALRVLDAGAHIGTCSLLLAAQGHAVVAFEPHLGSFSQLNASVHFNGWAAPGSRGQGLVELHQLALAERRGRRLLWEKRRNAAATVAIPEGLEPEALLLRAGHAHPQLPQELLAAMYANASWAEARPLDEVRVLGSRPPRAFDLAKLDVNGGELGLLKGAAKAFHTPPLIVKFEFWPELMRQLGAEPMELLQHFLRGGYDLWVLEDAKAGLATASRVLDNGRSVLEAAGETYDRFTDIVALSSVRWPARASLRETLGL